MTDAEQTERMVSVRPRVIDVVGTNRQIGRMHAAGAPDLRGHVVRWVEAAEHDRPPGSDSAVAEVMEAWQDLTPGTLDQIAGMAEVYRLPVSGLLTAVLSTYLHCLARASGPPDGCTTFAVRGDRPLLLKNRDNDPRFLPMQTVLRTVPDMGHPWVGLTTAGAPGVHSSGMNAAGLSVADTHVPATDVGPGVPRFAAMMHLLEQFTTTQDAVAYLLSTPMMGLGNLTLVDAHGEAAVVECGYRRSEVVHRNGGERAGETTGVAVATNHFTSRTLSPSMLEPAEGTPAANSRARATVVRERPEIAPGATPEDLREVAASHTGIVDGSTQPGSLCQHGPNLRSETISTTIFDPVNRQVDLCIGRPCTGTFSRITPPRR